MSATTHTATPAVAARRITLRDTLASILQHRIPDHLAGDPEAVDLFHSDACDAAEVILADLETLGFVVVAEARA